MFRFEAELWLWDGNAAWHFVTLPSDVSQEIRERTAGPRRGFGSVRVRVTCGSSTWSTSVFPDKQRAAYVLPVKKSVRGAEHLSAGDIADFELDLLDA